MNDILSGTYKGNTYRIKVECYPNTPAIKVQLLQMCIRDRGKSDCPLRRTPTPSSACFSTAAVSTLARPFTHSSQMCIRDRTQTACGREIQVISVFPRHGSETVEDKLKALAELDFQQGKLCA